MLIENTNRWRQCALKIDKPVEIFVRTPIQPIEQQAACRWEGDDDDDDHSYDDMIMVMVMTTISMMRWWWWLCLKFSWESGCDQPSNKPPLCLTDKLNSCHIMVGAESLPKLTDSFDFEDHCSSNCPCPIQPAFLLMWQAVWNAVNFFSK